VVDKDFTRASANKVRGKRKGRRNHQRYKREKKKRKGSWVCNQRDQKKVKTQQRQQRNRLRKRRGTEKKRAYARRRGKRKRTESRENDQRSPQNTSSCAARLKINPRRARRQRREEPSSKTAHSSASQPREGPCCFGDARRLVGEGNQWGAAGGNKETIRQNKEEIERKKKNGELTRVQRRKRVALSVRIRKGKGGRGQKGESRHKHKHRKEKTATKVRRWGPSRTAEKSSRGFRRRGQVPLKRRGEWGDRERGTINVGRQTSTPTANGTIHTSRKGGTALDVHTRLERRKKKGEVYGARENHQSRGKRKRRKSKTQYLQREEKEVCTISSRQLSPRMKGVGRASRRVGKFKTIEKSKKREETGKEKKSPYEES